MCFRFSYLSRGFWHPDDVTPSKSYDFTLNLVRVTRDSAQFVCPCTQKCPIEGLISIDIVEGMLSTRFTWQVPAPALLSLSLLQQAMNLALLGKAPTNATGLSCSGSLSTLSA